MLSHLVRAFTAFLLVISLPPDDSAIAQNAPQQTPVTISENLLYVQVHVNGHGPYNFILDSGVSGIGRIDRRLAKELGLNIVGYQENSDGYHVKTEILVGVEKLRVGQTTNSHLKLMVRDYNTEPRQIPIEGVIGRDFFYDYLLTIDGPARQLLVSRETLDVQTKGVLSYSKPFLIAGKAGQTHLSINLDTGSNLSFHFPASLLAGIQYINTPNKREITQANTTFVLQEAVLNDELIVGSVKVKDQKIYYSDKAHQINVGMDFLKEHTITLDQRKKLVRID